MKAEEEETACASEKKKRARAGELVLEDGQNGPEVYRTGIEMQGLGTEAPAFWTTSTSCLPPRKICSWPAAVGEPASTCVVHSTGCDLPSGERASQDLRLALKRPRLLPTMAATVYRVVGRPLAL
ncbi:hypothetical protein HPB50_014220 [Hyalomma asiaticum]|uniref:Uncharacterized protein n=1 Tax=Hyalomma asiaticum TaxID=266040 RepID=A0ACB7TKG5_HYAAI|nr:hypothetical protein HPB50_014220 [Hyalomma asiaticum]